MIFIPALRIKPYASVCLKCQLFPGLLTKNGHGLGHPQIQQLPDPSIEVL